MRDLQIIQITHKGVRHFQTGHPWIYKSDLKGVLPQEAGVTVVEDPSGRFLAQALFSPKSQISLRILSKKKETIDKEWFKGKIKKAIDLRGRLQIQSDAVRLVFGESDGLPAFIVDRFADVISFQTLCAGIDHYKNELVDILNEELRPRAIVERNDVPVRKLEGLPLTGQVLKGDIPDRVKIREGNISLYVDALHGQKTGAYLDQRDNRLLAGRIACGKVLDCFSYEGWFAAHMTKNAESVLCVDSSGPALENAKENAKQNNLLDKIRFCEANCFDFLKKEDSKGTHYDCINLDPPPFVKSARDCESGYRGYKEINLRAMKLLRPEGILITSSCSHHFSDEDFDAVLADAANDASVTAQVLYRTGAAPDHPVLAGFPESHYLKCRILKIAT